ncbi:MAG TPA: hypothetical protein VHF01_06115 [Candidatus Acidoferrum sp.]|nr:hypothetical protein [Candidatus Acidoferrum sp.]
MALDDRERSFEKALARRLRANAAAAACPDAETLAAYHERSLTPAEVNTWEQHMAACVSCQEILAQLEATEEIPSGADQHQNAAVEGANLFEAVYVAEEAPVAAAPVPAAPPPVKTKKTAAVVSLPRSPKQQRAAHWRWLAPAGALAAGLLVWVAVHEKQPAKVMQPAKIEVAENRPSAPPVETTATVDRENAEKLAPSSKATTATDNRAAASGVLQNRKAELAAKVVPASPEGAFAKSDRKDADLNTVAQAHVAVTESTGVGDVAGASKSKQTEELPMQQRGVDNLVQLQTSTPKPVGGAPGPGPFPQMETKSVPASKAASAAPPPAAVETLELSAGSRDASAFRMAKSRSPRPVPAPGGKVIWRLGAAGLIELSIDSGLTWTPQTSGTTTDLFLGSSPSEQVCWVIGIGGTILRTADGGTHWLPVVSPISQNLGLIRASDALHATVWDMSRRHSFQTADGGLTWTQISGQ